MTTTAVETVRSDLNSIAPTAQTLQLLRNVLGLEPSSNTKLPPVGAKKPLGARKPVKPRGPVRGATKQSRIAASNFQIHSGVLNEEPHLSSADRSRIATEAFNVTLKHLGTAAKAQRDTPKPAGGASTPPRLPPPQTALKDRSPNREGKKGPSKKTQGSQLQPEEPNLKVLAECSTAALQFLRENGSVEGPTRHDISLENAALILVDRCISLGLTSQAQHQLHELHRRYWEDAATKRSCTTKTTAGLLLGRSDAAEESSRFGFTTSMQSQVLRFALLLGPLCLNHDLLRSIRLETVGSPGWVTLQGLLKGHLKPEEAGLQLRTISLALTKLYSLTIKSTSEAACANEAFDLFCLALRIKFESWTLLGHRPEPTTEVWRPVHAAVKRVFTHAKRSQTAECSISQALRSFRDLLSVAKCDNHVPTELTDNLLQLVQGGDERLQILALAEEELQSCEPLSSLILSCQITASRLRDLSSDTQMILKSAERTTSAFRNAAVLPVADLDRVLLHIAHLRKAAVEALTALGDVANEELENDMSGKLLRIVIRLTYTGFEFLRRQLRSTGQDQPNSSRKEQHQAFLTTLIKSVDAILATEKYSVTRSPEMCSEACDTLKSCLNMAESLPVQFASLFTDSSVQTAINQLQVRLSQSFWARFLKAVEQRKEVLDQVALLNLSLKGLSGLPLLEQKAAYIGLKYERLAACYLEMNNYKMSLAALRTAIEFSISEGVLSEVVEHLSSGTFSNAWTRPDSNCKVLGRNLMTYARTLIAYVSSPGDDDNLFDNQSFSPIHRAALLERQIYALLEQELADSQLQFCASQARRVLALLSKEEYQVYKLRFICNVVNFGLRKKMSASTFLLEPLDVQTSLELDKAMAQTTFLRPYEPGLRLLLSLLYGFFTARIDSQVLGRDVKQLSKILRQCANLDSLRSIIDDLETCVSALSLAADFAEMFEDHGTVAVALEALQHLVSIGAHCPKLSEVNVLVRLGKLHCSLQAMHSAEKAFAQVEKVLHKDADDALHTIDFALAYSQYHLNHGHLERCLDWLQRGKNSWETRPKSNRSVSTKSRLREQSYLCRASFVASQLAYERGCLSDAVNLGRQSAKIASTLWLAIDTYWSSTFSSQPESQTDPQLNNVVADFSKLNLSLRSGPRMTATMVVYWEEVSLYCKVVSHVAFLHSHCGLYQDATQFYEQALKVARKAGLSKVAAVISSSLALIHARAGHSEKARTGIKDLRESIEASTNNLPQALVDINLSDIHLLLGDTSAASRYLLEAMQYLHRYGSHREEPKSHNAKPKGQQIAVRPPGRKPAVKDQKKVVSTLGQSGDSDLTYGMLPLDLKSVYEKLFDLEARFRVLDNSGVISPVTETLVKIRGSHDYPRASMVNALRLVQAALKMFSEDAVHNVLAETAVALPVRYRSSRKSGRVSFVHSSASVALADDRIRKNKKGSRAKQVERDPLKDGSEVLLEAYDLLHRIDDSQQSRLSPDVAHTIHKTLTRIRLLSTALGEPFVTSSADLILDALSPMDLARERERLITMGELATAEKGQNLMWPKLDMDRQSRASLEDGLPPSYDLSLLPSSWSVIFLGLSEDRSELFVARLAPDRSPFVVRIPLARPDISDTDHQELDFHFAKAEIQSIITKANDSAHDPRGSSRDKSVRKAWYAERQSLDKQLGQLLENIENVWFGGFRGLLSASDNETTELLKFGKSLSSTLNKHLPSRRKSSKPVGSKVELHDHVLELFVALGHPRDIELEDAITDLLYFVIDILQFNGERNAYDEIDFDAMMVEITDALHAYHDTMELRPRQQDSHVILIVDKELQVFPWESLTCLRGQAVSRMPSLGAMWERLEVVRQQTGQPNGHLIPRSEGAYILNPSSDLMSTQDTFGQLFHDQLSEFKAIVNRPPSEKEFETVLHDSSLVLYFGHGGGAQYIRGRTIRRMNQCAVTLLMGCSSAKMTECGVYEPYGMPWNYLNGGSPAVVGTLWDVTDRDIDRFAIDLMNDWGLIDGAGGSEPKAEKNPRKGRGGQEGQTSHCSRGNQVRGPVSLDQAVAHARDACLLRYLNGAAPVMYGIPVFLD